MKFYCTKKEWFLNEITVWENIVLSVTLIWRKTIKENLEQTMSKSLLLLNVFEGQIHSN